MNKLDQAAANKGGVLPYRIQDALATGEPQSGKGVSFTFMYVLNTSMRPSHSVLSSSSLPRNSLVRI